MRACVMYKVHCQTSVLQSFAGGAAAETGGTRVGVQGAVSLFATARGPQTRTIHATAQIRDKITRMHAR